MTNEELESLRREVEALKLQREIANIKNDKLEALRHESEVTKLQSRIIDLKNKTTKKYDGNRIIYILFWFFFGSLGLHNFYIGRIGMGLAELLLVLLLGWFFGIGIIIWFVLWLCDLFMLGSEKVDWC